VFGRQRNSMALPDSLVSLMSPHAYAHAVETVQLVETHISWILLTGEFAYKIKRPVAFPFVDLRSAERRAFLCKEEVRLNRRFAAEIYIGVCNITSDENGARFDGKGRVVEHAVKMVQFERREQLDALLAAQQIAPGELETFGDELAGIHASLPSAEPAHEWGRPESVRATIVRNLDECTQVSRGFGGADLLEALRQPLEKMQPSAAAAIAGSLLIWPKISGSLPASYTVMHRWTSCGPASKNERARQTTHQRPISPCWSGSRSTTSLWKQASRYRCSKLTRTIPWQGCDSKVRSAPGVPEHEGVTKTFEKGATAVSRRPDLSAAYR
jgi:hypothetical protein